jgi:selenide,water dikinase
MGPEALAQVLRPLAGMFDSAQYPSLLRGLDTPDDALVWKLDEERALVQTADFFPPVVDDPFHFGAIAAANAMSDIYAMGADPIVAINLVGFPEDVDIAVLSDILRGGAEKVREAGAVVAGGHTTVDREPKYGLAVTGLVHPARMLTKGGARPGDVLFLTKPIGTGVVTTAHKRQRVDDDDLDTAVASMERLSGRAAKLLREAGGAVHALTDVTGFALAGHAHELAEQSGCALRLDWDAVPRLPGAARYAREKMVPGGSHRNERYYGPWIAWGSDLEEWERRLLFDPQTSGGLLAAVDPTVADRVRQSFADAVEPVWRIGEVVEGRGGGLELVRGSRPDRSV